MRKLIKHNALCAALALTALALPVHAQTFSDTQVRVPRGTASTPNLVWSSSANNGLGAWILDGTYSVNGLGQMAVGGSVDPNARLSVNPQGASENGLKITVPSGYTGQSLGIYSSANALLAGINAGGVGYFSGGNANCVQIGGSTSSVGQGVTIGQLASSTANGGIAVGFSATASYLSFALGYGAQATGNSTCSIGFLSSAPFNGTFALGPNLTTTALGQFVLGNASSEGSPTSDVYIGNGVTNAVSNGFTLHPTGALGTDKTAGSLVLAGGQSTGAGAGGKVYIATSNSAATGTTLNALTNRVQVDATGLTVLGGNLSAPTITAGNGITQTVNGTTYTGGIATAYNPNAASVSGPVNAAITSSSTYSIVANVDRFEIANAMPNSVVFQLPDPTNYSGPEIDLSRNDTSATNTVTITAAGTGKTITGYTSVSAQYQVRHCVRLADGSGWFVF